MIRRLLRCHPPGAHFFFNDRMVFGFAMEFAVRTEAIEPGIADVPDGRAMPVEVKRYHGSRHHQRARILARLLMDRTVGTMNSQSHATFVVFPIRDAFTKGII